MEDLHEFYEGYIAAFNARDADAFAACFHPPVTMLSGRGALRPGESPCSVVDDPGGFPGQMPAHWSHTTIDAVTALDDVAPFTIAAGLPEPRRRRKGLVTSVSRWDQEGTCYEQVQVLYLLSERDGRWGITVVADLGFTRRRSQEPASPERG